MPCRVLFISAIDRCNPPIFSSIALILPSTLAIESLNVPAFS